MPFSISFLDEPVFYDEERPLAVGELVLGDYGETFDANLFEWSKQAYEAQWRKAIKAILEGTKSALMVYYVSQSASTNFEWWPMYREGNIVYFQNHMPWYDQLPWPLTPENMLSLVKSRITINEDGDRISEWSVKLSDIEDFARTLPA